MTGREESQPLPSPTVMDRFYSLQLQSPIQPSVPISPFRNNQQVSPPRSPYTIGCHLDVKDRKADTGKLKRRLFDTQASTTDSNSVESPRQKRLSRGISCEVLPDSKSSESEQGRGIALLSTCTILENYPQDNLDQDPMTESNFVIKQEKKQSLVRVASNPSRSSLTLSSVNINRKKRAESIRNTSFLTPTVERRVPENAEFFMQDHLRNSSPNVADWRHSSTDSFTRTGNTPRRSTSMTIGAPFPFDESCQLLRSTKKEGCHYVNTKTVLDLISKKTHSEYNMLVIDCRFEYEYNGGHIKDAMNVVTTEDLEMLLLTTTLENSKRSIIIFHCEFSSKRGPTMCKYLRRRDRELHSSNYPELYYPEIYVMEGGYKKFFEEFKEQCEPEFYLTMDDPAYKQECRDGLKLIGLQGNNINGTCRPKRSQSMSSMTTLSQDFRSPRSIVASRMPMKDLSNLPPRNNRNSLMCSTSSLSTGRLERRGNLFNAPSLLSNSTSDLKETMRVDIPDSLMSDDIQWDSFDDVLVHSHSNPSLSTQ